MEKKIKIKQLSVLEKKTDKHILIDKTLFNDVYQSFSQCVSDVYSAKTDTKKRDGKGAKENVRFLLKTYISDTNETKTHLYKKEYERVFYGVVQKGIGGKQFGVYDLVTEKLEGVVKTKEAVLTPVFFMIKMDEDLQIISIIIENDSKEKIYLDIVSALQASIAKIYGVNSVSLKSHSMFKSDEALEYLSKGEINGFNVIRKNIPADRAEDCYGIKITEGTVCKASLNIECSEGGFSGGDLIDKMRNVTAEGRALFYAFEDFGLEGSEIEVYSTLNNIKRKIILSKLSSPDISHCIDVENGVDGFPLLDSIKEGCLKLYNDLTEIE
jgi:hypothetical protein